MPPDPPRSLCARDSMYSWQLGWTITRLLPPALYSREYLFRACNCKSRWLKHVNILSMACLLPFKQSPESGDPEWNGYWSYTRPFSPPKTQEKAVWTRDYYDIYTVSITHVMLILDNVTVNCIQLVQQNVHAAILMTWPLHVCILQIRKLHNSALWNSPIINAKALKLDLHWSYITISQANITKAIKTLCWLLPDW